MSITADFPSNPSVGDVQLLGSIKYKFDGQGWIPVATKGPVYIQPNEPVGALPGELWWDSDPPHMLYVNYDNGLTLEWTPVMEGNDRVQTISIVISQASHGFDSTDIGMPVCFSSGNWVAAKADTASTVHTACIRSIVDSDRFEICIAGFLDNISPAVNGSTVLEAGHFYRLSSTVAGQVTKLDPSPLEIFAPVFLAVSDDSAVVLPYRAGKGALLTRQKQTWTNVVGKKVFDFAHSPGRLEVFINGLYQHPSSKFTSSADGSQFTLAVAVASNNDIIEAIADSEVGYANTYTRAEADQRFPIKSWSASSVYLADYYTIYSGNLVKANTNPTPGSFVDSQWNAIPVNADTVNVVISQTGVAIPENPLAGDPFNSFKNAILWLNKYVNYSVAYVTIQGGSYSGSWYIPPNKSIIVTALGAVTINAGDNRGMNIAGALEWIGSPLTINSTGNTEAVNESTLYTDPWDTNWGISGITLHGNGVAWFYANLSIVCTGTQSNGITCHSPGTAFRQIASSLSISAVQHGLYAGAGGVINIAEVGQLTLSVGGNSLYASLGGQIWADGAIITNNSVSKVALAVDRGFIRTKANALSGWTSVSPTVGSGLGNHGSEIYYVGT